jgi:hypothetical protein
MDEGSQKGSEKGPKKGAENLNVHSRLFVTVRKRAKKV